MNSAQPPRWPFLPRWALSAASWLIAVFALLFILWMDARLQPSLSALSLSIQARASMAQIGNPFGNSHATGSGGVSGQPGASGGNNSPANIPPVQQGPPPESAAAPASADFIEKK